MNINTLHKYYLDGYLIKQVHPTLPLTIWNYSQKTQFEGKWDEVTLHCRGLVVDNFGNVVARPFKKFFNMEEGQHTSTKDFDVYEKMDGSLGIAFYYQDQWVFASRGSFTSEQAIKGSEMFKEQFTESHFIKDMTYIYEIIYPNNRIVVCYGGLDRLVLLGRIGTKAGEEYSIESHREKGYDVVREYKNTDYNELKGLIGSNFEGFVVRFTNGDRMKIKGDEYIRLHKIMTEISTKSVWECLSNGDDIYEMLKDVPDEFFKGIEKYIEELKSEYSVVEQKSIATFNIHKDLNRKDFAAAIEWNRYSSVLFRMKDDKDYSENIWRFIKPEYKRL
jgi:RNA ligase